MGSLRHFFTRSLQGQEGLSNRDLGASHLRQAPVSRSELANRTAELAAQRLIPGGSSSGGARGGSRREIHDRLRSMAASASRPIKGARSSWHPNADSSLQSRSAHGSQKRQALAMSMPWKRRLSSGQRPPGRLACVPARNDRREGIPGGARADWEYDGPVRAEPLNRKLNDVGDDEACETTVAAMREAFSLIGYPSHRERTACSG